MRYVFYKPSGNIKELILEADGEDGENSENEEETEQA